MVVIVEDIQPQRRAERSTFGSLLPTCEESRAHLAELGVPAARLPSDPADVDLVGLLCSLDRLFATGCGHAGVKYFLREPLADLEGRAPEDLILEPGGIELIRTLVAAEVELARG